MVQPGEELAHQVEVTVFHELGHYFGLKNSHTIWAGAKGEVSGSLPLPYRYLPSASVSTSRLAVGFHHRKTSVCHVPGVGEVASTPVA